MKTTVTLWYFEMGAVSNVLCFLRFECVEDCGLHDVVSAGEFLQAVLLGLPVIFSFNIIIILKDEFKHAMVQMFLHS